MKTIKVPLSKDGIKFIQELMLKFTNALSSKEFMEYIGRKAKETLEQVTLENLTTTIDEEDDSEHYRRNHDMEIQDNQIILFNRTMVEFESKYGNGSYSFDLAKAVEYGVGYTGANSEAAQYASEYGWEYDINEHGIAGWYYINKEGKRIKTSGYQGRLIFLKTKNRIEENINSWVEEYITKYL